LSLDPNDWTLRTTWPGRGCCSLTFLIVWDGVPRTAAPTLAPTQPPTAGPTEVPTEVPTDPPTLTPTFAPCHADIRSLPRLGAPWLPRTEHVLHRHACAGAARTGGGGGAVRLRLQHCRRVHRPAQQLPVPT
jgi:hypothetical protein